MTKPLITKQALELKLIDHEAWCNANISGSDIDEDKQLGVVDSTISNMSFKSRNLSSSIFSRCLFKDCTFEDCDLNGTAIFDSILESCSFIKCNFKNSQLNDNEGKSINFTGSDFSRSELQRDKFTNGNFSHCRFDQSIIIETDLRLAVLEDVTFNGAKLIRAKMFNTAQYKISFENTIIEQVDYSAEGNGSLQIGLELISLLTC